LDDIIVIGDLVKQYGNVRAVDGLTLSVGRGQIFGLLGPNGAGKTTTLRTLLGLCRPTSGTVLVHGMAPGASAALRMTGALIENPAFYPYLGGRDNLRLLARMRRLPDTAVDEALSVVDLAAQAGVKFRQYSLGMKQRLGVAAAILAKPRLLILDEPTNGLDPAGTADMRRLMMTMRGSGVTVILSSHLLGEVERVCDRIGVLETGRLVATGTVADLGSTYAATTVVIAATPIDLALATLLVQPSVLSATEEGGRITVKLRAEANGHSAGELNTALVLAGVVVNDIRLQRPNLEQVYLTLTAPVGAGAR
jgi:ABC-2 type transport system ATP-binding protein